MNTPPRPQSPRVHPGAVLLSPNGYMFGGNQSGTGMPISYPNTQNLDDIIDSNDLSPNFSNSRQGGGVFSSGNYVDGFNSHVPDTAGRINANNPGSQDSGLFTSNSVVNFTQDVNQLVYWMEKLSVSQQNTVMDNLLSSLDEEVLQYTKLKLDSLINTGYISPSPIASPILMANSMSMNNAHVHAFDLNSGNNGNTVLNSFMPLETTMSAPAMGPALSMNLTAAMPQPQMNSLDFIMGVDDQLNSEKIWTPKAVSPKNQPKSQGSKAMDFVLEQRPRSADPQRKTMDTSYGTKKPSETQDSGNSKRLAGLFSGTATSGTTVASSLNQNQAMQRDNLTDCELLNNIPMWLKSLRLHKYTDILQKYNWQELVVMTDADLIKNGIAALGARNKLLKAFKIVLESKEQGLIAGEAFQ